MKPSYKWMIVATLLVAASGCRNGNQCWRPNPLAGLGPSTITPPGTGSYQLGQPADPYYGTTLPAMPASGNSTVPAQPASNVSPGWRPAGSQVPVQPASHNQTSFLAPNPNVQQIPMNNVVSSTQTSLLRPTNQTAGSNNLPANNQPRLAGNPSTGGMPINDSTNLQSGPPGTWNQMANQNLPGSRTVVGGIEYSVQPTRSGGNVYGNQYNPYANPYNNGYSQTSTAAGYNAPPNTGWQERNPPNFSR